MAKMKTSIAIEDAIVETLKIFLDGVAIGVRDALSYRSDVEYHQPVKTVTGAKVGIRIDKDTTNIYFEVHVTAEGVVRVTASYEGGSKEVETWDSNNTIDAVGVRLIGWYQHMVSQSNRSASEKSAAAPRKSIYDDTPIIPDMIADSVVMEVGNYMYFKLDQKELATEYANKLKKKLVAMLVKRAEATYQADDSFAKTMQSRGNKGRDQLYVFMRHWLSAELKKTRPDIFKLLPTSFSNGHPI